MAGNPDVLSLLEEMLDSGRTPEEVCRDCPELLPEVRQRWEAFHRVDGAVAAFFPDTETPQNGDATQPTPRPAELPQVPGYRVEAVLGHGGMGVVYKAWQLRLQRPVALKMLLAGPYAGPKELERFQREAEAVAALGHANIVQVHDVGDVEGRPFFTMELVEGGDLAERIRGVPQPAREAAALVATLADAVHAAHQSGIVHRDLKPANILLARDGTPKVSDFGLARRLQGDGELTLSGTPVGTPSYMAPEQARGEKGAIGPATDVYALGAILYELLTGRPPFRAESAAATLQQVVADEPVPPARLNPQVPRDLETICLKCLQKEPAQRYASAAELAADLRRFLHDQPIQARPVGLLGRLARWGRRNPALAALASALALTALLAFVAILWQWRKAEAFATAEALANVRLDQERLIALDAQQRAERASIVERWERYQAEIAAAAAALQLQASSVAQRALEQAPEEHRNWEWRHLHSQLDNARAVLPGVMPAADSVLPLASPSGEQVATVDRDKCSLRLWDTATGTSLGILRGRDKILGAVVYSPHGIRRRKPRSQSCVDMVSPSSTYLTVRTPNGCFQRPVMAAGCGILGRTGPLPVFLAPAAVSPRSSRLMEAASLLAGSVNFLSGTHRAVDRLRCWETTKGDLRTWQLAGMANGLPPTVITRNPSASGMASPVRRSPCCAGTPSLQAFSRSVQMDPDW
jgi:hypothetical protein